MIVASLLSYHLQLIGQNLTTNEHIKMSSYSYLRNSYNLFENPFDKGSYFENFLDAICPSSKVYFHRAEVIEDTQKSLSNHSHQHTSNRPIEESEMRLLSEDKDML